MPRSYNLSNIRLPAASVFFSDTKSLVRLGLGILLAANLIAASFAFHLFGTSPEAINLELVSARTRLLAEQARLNRTRVLTANIEKGRGEGETFINNYMTGRRRTYSTIIGEITDMAKTTGMTMKEATIAPLDPIEGSDDLDMMTLSVNFEGGYKQLVELVNLLDRSGRFLIIDTMQASPQPKGDLLSVNLKLSAFVKEDMGGAGE